MDENDSVPPDEQQQRQSELEQNAESVAESVYLDMERDNEEKNQEQNINDISDREELSPQLEEVQSQHSTIPESNKIEEVLKHKLPFEPIFEPELNLQQEFELEIPTSLERNYSQINIETIPNTENVQKSPKVIRRLTAQSKISQHSQESDEFVEAERFDISQIPLLSEPLYQPDSERSPKVQDKPVKQPSKEYMEIVLQIESQNRIIHEIKKRICEKCDKMPRTKCETREIRNLKMCLEKESLKQKCLINKLSKIQEKDTSQQWGQVDLASSMEWDHMPLQIHLDYIQPIRTNQIEDKSKRRNVTQISKELHQSYEMQEKLVADNSDLECERYKLQEELLCRDRVIECLQHKIQLMQSDLSKLCREKQKMYEMVPQRENSSVERRFNTYKETTQCLEQGIEEMQITMKRLNLELEHLKKDRLCWKSTVDSDICRPPKAPTNYSLKTKDSEIKELKRNYGNLLNDYERKEIELKELQERLKGFCNGRNKRDSPENIELELLRQKINDYQDEQDEYRCLIKEQSDHLEDYRQKYLVAQQEVEEQKCILEKMEMNNKQIEDQVNSEIQRIKSKFQDKLKELAHLPKLLENEQIKLANMIKEKEDLETKLCIVCRELKAIKLQMGESNGNSPDWEGSCKKTENDLNSLKKQFDDLTMNKNMISDKLQKTQDDLDCLRTESARIIARTKERSEQQKQLLQNHIDRLEKELAQCRATASLSISDREEVIKDMQGQLNCLSSSFDSAQKQIKTLKDHISYMSNDKTIPLMM